MKRAQLCVLVLLSLGLSPAPPPQPPVKLVASADVVAAYNALSTLEPGQRKELYSALTADVRAELWRLQHQMYLADHPELTAEQRSLLYELAPHLTPELYSGQWKGTQMVDRVEVDRLHQRAAEIFSPDEMSAIFFRLGGDHAAQHRWQLRATFECYCAANSDCEGGLHCLTQVHGCTRTPNGCGPDLTKACTGFCG